MIQYLDTAAPRTILQQEHPLFPKRLLEIPKPPEFLHALGSIDTLLSPSLAIVGARKATPYGLSCAKHFARLAALCGITVISGGAVGCDQAAHKGALEVGGRTVVVLGCGADVVYPVKGEKLFYQVLEEEGTIISEAPWGSPPTKWGFKKRNRIIAGMAQATLIVEAGLPSGTFSTADATLEQGKEVLAVPGSIFAKESKGANLLIAQGAIPIVDDQTFTDALIQLFGIINRVSLFEEAQADTGIPKENNTTRAAEGANHKVIHALTQEPLRPESLLGICGDNVVEVIRYLSSLELAGIVERLRDGRYAVVSH